MGISLPAIGRWKIEFWYAPPAYSIEAHRHDKEDIELISLYGRDTYIWQRRNNLEFLSDMVTLRNLFRKYTVPAGTIHAFTTHDHGFLFMNIERWRKGVKPTSASEDLQLI